MNWPCGEKNGAERPAGGGTGRLSRNKRVAAGIPQRKGVRLRGRLREKEKKTLL